MIRYRDIQLLLFFGVSFWSEKVGSGQKFLSKLYFLYFLDREKVVKGSEKVGKWSVFGQF